tara:strand:+ start:229 stop:402 length:174 start_codon:yes stop_codon:yes gene_type:complete
MINTTESKLTEPFCGVEQGETRLHLLTDDLRLADNRALATAASATAMTVTFPFQQTR